MILTAFLNEDTKAKPIAALCERKAAIFFLHLNNPKRVGGHLSLLE
jgi:hypothetical protein